MFRQTPLPKCSLRAERCQRFKRAAQCRLQSKKEDSTEGAVGLQLDVLGGERGQRGDNHGTKDSLARVPRVRATRGLALDSRLKGRGMGAWLERPEQGDHAHSLRVITTGAPEGRLLDEDPGQDSGIRPDVKKADGKDSA